MTARDAGQVPTARSTHGAARPSDLALLHASPPRTYLREVGDRLVRNRTAMVGLAFILALVILGISTPWVAPFDYAKGSLLTANRPPNAVNWLGTDALGRDTLSRLLWGGRVSLTVAIGAQVIVVLIGVTLGLISGFVGGWTDYLIMRTVDALYSLPSLLVAVVVMSFLRGVLAQANEPSVAGLSRLNIATGGLLGVFIVLFLTHWLTVCRLVRAQVITVKEREFVLGARSLGAGSFRLVRVHILPHVLAPVLVALSFGIPGSIGLEASLSFLGIGVTPPMPSWGMMISEALPAMRTYPLLLVFPGVLLSVTLLSFTYLGDAVRDALDPLMKR
ncbi:MAG: ABC transporter permease [Chloroflexi bacterium]|nr:ABC transporter permease [Chloroflexota bacterium]